MAWLANRSSKVFSSVLDSHFAALEVTRVQWMALYYMNRNPEQKQTELAERLNCKSAALARLLDRMEKDGMLTRSVNAENRRSNRIELTEKGRRLCAESRADALRFGSGTWRWRSRRIVKVKLYTEAVLRNRQNCLRIFITEDICRAEVPDSSIVAQAKGCIIPERRYASRFLRSRCICLIERRVKICW